MALVDNFVMANTPKRRQRAFKAYPRPWDRQAKAWRPTVSQDRVRAALRARGHDI
jgi:hypothetical protein